MNQGKPSSLADTDARFRRYYARHLAPLEEQFESRRQKAVRERNLRLSAAVVAWLAALGGISFLAQPLGELWPFVAFFGLASAIGLGLWVWLPAGAHELRLQEQVLPRIVPFFGDLRYQSEPDLKPGHYRDWMVLPDFNKTYAEDQIEGSYRGIPLKLAEVRLNYQYRSGTDGRTSTGVAFKGVLISFKLTQDFPGVTLIRSEGSDMNKRFRLDAALSAAGGGFGFEIFATSDAPGASLADAPFLERLAQVSARFEAQQLFASFHADRLVMLIDHKEDFFEMSHRQETNFTQDATRVRDQLGQILAIVDLLQLGGTSRAAVVDDRSWENLEFPTLPGSETYDIGGWGCFGGFVILAVSMGAYLWLLDDTLPVGQLLWWSVLGPMLLTLGLLQVGRGVQRRAVGTVVLGVLFLAGALAVLYFYLPPEMQGLFRSWMPR